VRIKFGWALLAIVVVGFGVRVAYVAIAKRGPCEVRVAGRPPASYPSECTTGDQLFYNAEAGRLAKGDGFVEPLWYISHPGEHPPPAADHPPLTVVVLAPVSWLVEHQPIASIAGDSIDADVREQRCAMVVLGTVLVLLIGLLGRRIGGDGVGLVAAGIAAISPNIWVNDGLIMSETITGLIVVGAMLLAVSSRKEPTPTRVALLGVLCGLAALARAELILLIPLLAVPIAFRRPNRWRLVLTAMLASAIVITPWVAYNESRFHQATFISTNDGIALAGSNCDAVYYGAGTGLTSFQKGCLDDPAPPGDQSDVAKVYRQRAFSYIRTHKARAVVVVLARVGRTWSLYRPFDMVSFNEQEGREPWVTRLGLLFYYPTLLFALGGAVLLWRRSERWILWILVTPAIAVTIGSAATYGQTRFRAAAEPSLALLAAVGIVALAGRIQHHHVVAAREPGEHEGRDPVDDERAELHGVETEGH
jgi:4-amino-4-deoxy-L-arabinose transferase-like glycosyltransferase